MNKSDMAKRIYEKRPQYPYSVVHKSVDALIEQMCEKLSQGGRIELRWFGAFFIKRHVRRVTWNPKTKEKSGASVQTRVRFKVSPTIIRSLTRKAFNCIL